MGHCIICGHWLSDNNHTGIGCECQKAVNYVVKCKINADKEKFFALWSAETKVYQASFIEIFANTKFRSAFRKSFYESIKNAERISRKQLNVIIDMIDSKDHLFCIDVQAKASEARNSLYNRFADDIMRYLSREDIEKARQIIRGNIKMRND